MDKKQKIQEIITFLDKANVLKLVHRYGTTLDSACDSTAEHSWRLALMTFLIAQQYQVKVDAGRAMQIALVHDLAELETGDTDAYQQIVKKLSPESKREKEETAMTGILKGLSFGGMIYELWQEYEDQKTLEAKLVKALDKLEAFLHISEVGAEHYQQDDFYANYADEAVRNFDEAFESFPELSEFLNAIKADLKEQFEAVGVEWKELP